MNRTELPDSLYATTHELLRLIMSTAQQHVEAAKLSALVQRRDPATWTISAWTISAFSDAQVQAPIRDIDTALTSVAAAAGERPKLDNIVSDIDKVIRNAKNAVDAATSVIEAIP